MVPLSESEVLHAGGITVMNYTPVGTDGSVVDTLFLREQTRFDSFCDT